MAAAHLLRHRTAEIRAVLEEVVQCEGDWDGLLRCGIERDVFACPTKAPTLR
jgi:hypothetical protein